MLTQCPQCETIYRLGAADLGAAEGFVECGECGTQFNALERIADEPRFSADQSLPVDAIVSDTPEPTSEASEDNGPMFVLLDTDAAPIDDEPSGSDETLEATVPEGTFIDLDPVAAGLEPATQINASVPAQNEDETSPEAVSAMGADEPAVPDIGAPPGQTLSESDHAILFTDPSAEFDEEQAEDLNALDIDDVPAILQKEVAALNQPQRTPLRWVWLLLAVVFIVGLGLQLVWVLRGRIVTALPDTQPIYVAACERIGCRFEPAGAADAIELLSRDVRDHPRYLETLLVNATLVSRSQSAASFPVIQLGLYGNTGEVIGIRRFEPREYVDKSIDLAAGMPPNRPVYIVMEVAGVGDQAVSFEFSFL